jgi:hypothetical protein
MAQAVRGAVILAGMVHRRTGNSLTDNVAARILLCQESLCRQTSSAESAKNCV